MKDTGRDSGSEAAAEAITDAEWTVVKVLWAQSPLTAAEIIGRLHGKTSWNPKTIHTLIRRLVQKKVIAAQAGVSPYAYYPLVTQSACLREKTRSFIDRVYDGSFSLMVSRFVRDEGLTRDEVAALKRILDESGEG